MTQPSPPPSVADEIGIVGGDQPQPTTLASASDIISGLSGKSKNEAFQELVAQKAQHMTEAARIQQQLAKLGVLFDGSRATGVYVDGIFRTLEEARAEGFNGMPTIDSLLQQYNATQANIKMLNDLEGDLFDTDYKWANPASAVDAYLNSQEDFQKRVKFYVDMAKNFIAMEDDELDMAQDAAKTNAELLQKQQDLGVPIPGLGLRTWTPGPSMTTQAKMAAGWPVGNTDQLLAGGGGQSFATPEEWARAAGVPGYAGGTRTMPSIRPEPKSMPKPVPKPRGRVTGISQLARPQPPAIRQQLPMAQQLNRMPPAQLPARPGPMQMSSPPQPPTPGQQPPRGPVPRQQPAGKAMQGRPPGIRYRPLRG